jgi:hypothetical protein
MTSTDSRSARERGSTTAEFAVVLPSVVAVLAIAMSAVAATVAQVRCVDAARTGARAAARGESPSVAVAAAKAAAPSGSTVSLHREGRDISVDVHTRVSLLGPIAHGRLSVGVHAVERAPAEAAPESP